jgi:hypothetical protein
MHFSVVSSLISDFSFCVVMQLWAVSLNIMYIIIAMLFQFVKGVFAPLYLPGSACRTGTGQAEPVPTAPTTHVCVYVSNEPGPSEIVFATIVPMDLLTTYQFLVALPPTVFS